MDIIYLNCGRRKETLDALTGQLGPRTVAIVLEPPTRLPELDRGRDLFVDGLPWNGCIAYHWNPVREMLAEKPV